MGQQATLADAPRVFVLNVRNREGNPAAGGHFVTFDQSNCPPKSGRSSTTEITDDF
jgi:hypothetical protein